MRQATMQSAQDLTQLLQLERSKKTKRSRRWIAGVTAFLLILAIGYSLVNSRAAHAAILYQSEAVTRGNLHIAISATGNLQPTNKVDVGSELSGTVEAVLVQQNDRVRKGQVLARLDTSKLKEQAAQSEAALLSAQARLAQTEATEKEDNANLQRLREVSQLSGGKVPSKTEMATAEAALARALADGASARAAVVQARAVVSGDTVSLSKASIQSPIDGIVLSRSVEPGQTVAAAMQVTTLFTIAGDLRQMELKVDVDEADVGNVRNGQQADFSVDAHSGRQYTATVTRVAYGSQTKDNVVSYATVLKVRNDDLSLRPGMTATARITTAVRDNVLLVPNAALRFMPSITDQPKESRGLVGSLMPGPPPGRPSHPISTAPRGSLQHVWTLKDGQPVSLAVTTGATDGKLTEITSDNLRENTPVITDSGSETK